MEELFETTPILPPPPQFAKRRSGLFIDRTFKQEPVQPSGEESLAIKEYLKKVNTERQEFATVWAKTRKHGFESTEPPILDPSLLATDQQTFVKGGPDLKEFIDTVMATTKQVEEFTKRKNRLLKRQDFVIDKFDYVLSNKVADLITEAEFSS